MAIKHTDSGKCIFLENENQFAIGSWNYIILGL